MVYFYKINILYRVYYTLSPQFIGCFAHYPSSSNGPFAFTFAHCGKHTNKHTHKEIVSP